MKPHQSPLSFIHTHIETRLGGGDQKCLLPCFFAGAQLRLSAFAAGLCVEIALT